MLTYHQKLRPRLAIAFVCWLIIFFFSEQTNKPQIHKTCDEMFRHFCRWIKTRRQCSGATRSNQNWLSCIERRDQFGRDPIRRKLLVLDLSLTIRVWGRKLPCLSCRREEHTSRFVNRAQRLSPTTLNQVHTHSVLISQDLLEQN